MNKIDKKNIHALKPPESFEPQIDILVNKDQTKVTLQVEMPIDSLPYSLQGIKQHMDKMNFMRENWEKFSRLTKREEGVLKLLVKGLKHQEISEQLFISEKTVKTHRRNIVKKLECKHMVDLYRFAEVFGLI